MTRRRSLGGVEAARARLLGEDDLEELTRLFRLLGDATRARLLYALLEAGELCVCDLSAATGTQPVSPDDATARRDRGVSPSLLRRG